MAIEQRCTPAKRTWQVRGRTRSPSLRHRRPSQRPLRQQDLPQSGLTQPVGSRRPDDRRLAHKDKVRLAPDGSPFRPVALTYRTSREEPVRHVSFEPARPLDTGSMPWIRTGPGKSFRPLRFAADGWSELMRLEPGSAVAVHRHTGEVHAFNLA